MAKKEMKKKSISEDTADKKVVSSSTCGRKRKVFECCAPAGSQVYLAGDFNNWDTSAQQMTEKDGVFRCTKMLTPGIYEYKFYVNGEWQLDANCENVKQNDCGSLNSVIVVE